MKRIYSVRNKNRAIVIGIPTLIVAVVALSAIAASVAPAAMPGTLAPVKSSAKGGTKQATVTLPVNYPSSVPLPSGTLLAASTTGSSWTVSLLVPGAYPNVYAATDLLYQQAGFTKSTASENPQLFQNSAYSVTVHSRAYDHGPESTEVLVVVSQN